MVNFGPQAGIDSKDYVLYKEGDAGITDTPIDLLGHSLTAPSPNLTDLLNYTTVKYQGGKVVPVQYVKRAAQELSRTYTIGIPSALWTPVIEQTYKVGCTANFFMKYTCPEDSIYDHFFILPDSVLGPAVEAEDVITNAEDTNMITQTSDLQTPGKLVGWKLGFEPIYSAGGTNQYLDIDFKSVNCVGCDDTAGFGLIAVGGDGTAVGLATDTDNRFSSVAALTGWGAAGDVALAMFTEGDTIIISYVDQAGGAFQTALAVAAAEVSVDGGANWSVITGMTDAILDFTRVGNYILAVGQVPALATNPAGLWISSDQGSTFTEVTNSALPTDQPLRSISYDETTQKFYICGDGGTLLVGRVSAGVVSLIDVSASLPGAPTALHAVKVLGKNEVLVGGASGYLARTRDGSTWSAVTFPSSGTIRSIDGNQYRYLIGAGTSVYIADFLTNYAITAVVFENGTSITGNVTRIRMGRDGDFNRFVVATDDGEVALGKPFYPNA